MSESGAWREVDLLLANSPKIWFSLSRSRFGNEMVWQAVFYTEKGRVVGRSRAGERAAALEAAVKACEETDR